MRVLHLTRPASGGVLRFLQSVLPRLQDEGVRIEVSCPQSMHSALPQIATRSWEITDHPHPVNDVRCALEVRRWEGGFDIVHAHGLRAVGVLALMPPRRWVISLHNLPPEHLSPPLRALLRRASTTASLIHTVSGAVMDGWIRLFPDSASKCVVVPGGVDTDAIRFSLQQRTSARRQWNLPEANPVALCVARLMSDKGVDVLLRALVHAPEWYVLIVGDGPDREHLVQLAGQSGAGERVRFTGYLPSLEGAWAASDLAVVPSRREGLGLFALEAMAVGKPVIASSSGGLAETVRHGETGWLVPPDDVSALANALQNAYRQRDCWEEMGKRGREHVLQNYTWDRTAQQLLERYRRLLST